jgi:hypothetical protein
LLPSSICPKYVAKLAHTRNIISSTNITSHQKSDTDSRSSLQPSSFPLMFFFPLRWRSFTVPGTKVAPFPFIKGSYFLLPALFFRHKTYQHRHISMQTCDARDGCVLRQSRILNAKQLYFVTSFAGLIMLPFSCHSRQRNALHCVPSVVVFYELL